jgi:hypothetical protein
MKETYVRQSNNSGALLNTDNEGLAAYKRQRQIMSNIGSFQDRLQKVENGMEEIKNLLVKIAENGKDK